MRADGHAGVPCVTGYADGPIPLQLLFELVAETNTDVSINPSLVSELARLG